MTTFQAREEGKLGVRTGSVQEVISNFTQARVSWWSVWRGIYEVLKTVK